MTYRSEPRDRVLIVGYGYAGRRFSAAIQHLSRTGTSIDLVGICDQRDGHQGGVIAPTFTDLGRALASLDPTVVCVTVNEAAHVGVFETLGRWPTPMLVLAEKPLAVDLDETERARGALLGHAFSMNMVERFSAATEHCQAWLAEHAVFRVVRVESFWGKHRIGDTRPTMGVLSELIHPMDLTRLLFAPEPIVAAAGIGTHSDFSPCAETALDSVSVVVHAGDTPVVIHSSFVWSRRIRSLTAVVRADDRMYRIELVYDTPKWDCDRLEIVRIDLGGRLEPVYTHATDVTDLPSTIRGVGKVAAYVKRSVDSWRNGRPDPMLVRLEEAVGLQRDLHAIHASLGSTLAAGGYHGTTTSIAAH